MIKAAKQAFTATVISAGILLSASSILNAQSGSSDIDAAAQQAIVRQEVMKLLRDSLDKAKAMAESKQLGAAAREYEDALQYTQTLGPALVETEYREVIDGITSVRLQLASDALKQKDIHAVFEAEKQVARVLRINPDSVAAKNLQMQIDKAADTYAGNAPEKTALESVDEYSQRAVQSLTKTRNGILFYEAGQLEKAEEELDKARILDPENLAAKYYLMLVQEKIYKRMDWERDLESKKQLIQVKEAWTRRGQNNLPDHNPFASTNLVNTSKYRRNIYHKLDRIKLNRVEFDQLPLVEVVRTLKLEAKTRDPDQEGINFLINSNAERSSGGIQFVFDPVTGQSVPVPGGASEVSDLNDIIINIVPALDNLTLLQVLEVVVRVADQPIKYSIHDWGIEFTRKLQEPVELETRFFDVDPNTFISGLEGMSAQIISTTSQQGGGGGGGGGLGGGGGGGGGSVSIFPRVDLTGLGSLALGGGGGGGGLGGGGGGGGGGLGGGGGAGGGGGGGVRFLTTVGTNSIPSDEAMDFFLATAGIDLRDPGKSLFFNDRLGRLMIRAEKQELDTIEQAIHVMNAYPPQVTIEARFTEISQTDTKALGFDWWLGNSLLRNGSIVTSGGTQPSFQGRPSPGNPIGSFPGLDGNTTVPPSGTDTLLTGGLRNRPADGGTIPALFSMTGILTDPQFRVVLRALERRDGVDFLSETTLTTISGRQAQINNTENLTIVASIDQSQQGSGGGAGGGGGGQGGFGQGGGTGVAAGVNFPTTQLSTGPVLDVIPYVLADGYTIQMTILPTIVEFLGYDDPGPFLPQVQSVAGSAVGIPLTSVLPLPRTRVRYVMTSVLVWDGQTVVLGGLISENVQKVKDKIPFLGDLPIIGKLFRSEGTKTVKKNLVIFVTPTIIDPAGNRRNDPDNPKFDPSTYSIPD